MNKSKKMRKKSRVKRLESTSRRTLVKTPNDLDSRDANRTDDISDRGILPDRNLKKNLGCG